MKFYCSDNHYTKLPQLAHCYFTNYGKYSQPFHDNLAIPIFLNYWPGKADYCSNFYDKLGF